MSKEKRSYKSVTIRLDEDLAMMLDRAMISFGLDNRGQTLEMAVRAWLAAVLEDATVHQMCQMAVTQIRENEYAALRKFYADRSKDFATVDLHELRALISSGRDELGRYPQRSDE